MPPAWVRRPDILILGQGLAGTMLGWALARAGISFAIMDAGHERAATMAGAGILNPITGRRLVKSWRYEDFLPAARMAYRELEEELDVSLWREMRVRRIFADEAERTTAAEAQQRAPVGPFIEAVDASGWWIRGAARVDLPALLAWSRRRWTSTGRFRTEEADLNRELERHALVIDCRGRGGAESSSFDFVPWEFSKGELIELEIDGLAADVILNRRIWVVPTQPGLALAGATHEPGVREPRATVAARETITTAVREMVGPDRTFSVTGQRAGVRVNLPDRRPVAGRHPGNPRLGVLNGLGAKGALWAPELARAWTRHLMTDAAFDGEIDVRRYASDVGRDVG